MVEATLEPVGEPNGDEHTRELLVRQARELAALRRQLAHAQRVWTAGRLALGIVHDVHSAIGCIINFNELATEADAEDARHCREEIARNGRRAIALTQQLLALGRHDDAADAEDAGDATTPVHVDALLSELRGTLERLFGNEVDFQLTMASDRAQVRVAPIHLTQILLNLATNAQDALAEGGRCTINTARTRDEERQDLVEITVSDTGDGISERELDRVFDPFFTTKPAGHGTGLGLSVVADLVRTAGGRIIVESAVGKGSTFRVQLPVVD